MLYEVSQIIYIIPLFIVTFTLVVIYSLFAEYRHTYNQNISHIGDNDRHVVCSSKEYPYFLPSHKLEAHSEISQEVVYQYQLNIMQLMSPFF